MKKHSYVFFLIFLLVSFYSPKISAKEVNKQTYIVTFKKGPRDLKLIEDAGGKIKHKFKYINSELVELTESQFKKLKQDKRIQNIYLDQAYARLSSEDEINEDSAQYSNFSNYYNSTSGTLTGKGVNIAVIDSGVNANHEDLKVSEIYQCYNQVDSCKLKIETTDVNGHGTHVTGIIAAQRNGIGVKGVAPGSTIISYAAANPGTDVITHSAQIRALENILNKNLDNNPDNNIDIVNMSYGTIIDNEEIKGLLQQVHDSGSILVAAAGNEDSGVTYPAKYSEVVAVANVRYNPFTGKVAAAFSSNYGPEIDISAVGQEVKSTYIPNNDSYKTLSGTSMAAPTVSGILALYKEQYPYLKNTELENLLYENAVDISDPGKDDTTGYGIAKIKIQEENEKYKGLFDMLQVVATPSNSSISVSNLYDNQINSDTIIPPGEQVTMYLRGTIENANYIFMKYNESTEGKPVDIVFNSPENYSVAYTTLNNSGWKKINASEFNKIVISNPGATSISIKEFEVYGTNPDFTKQIKQKFIPQNTWSSTFLFYDKPDESSTYVTNASDIRNKVFYTTKGYGYKNGRYEWYQVSIPSEDIYDKWVNYGVDSVMSDSLNNLVYNKVVKENNFGDSWGGTYLYDSTSYRLYKFEKPINVKDGFIQVNHLAMGEGLKIKYEFLDENLNLIGSYTTNDSDLFDEHFSFPQEYSNVSYLKISNATNQTIVLSNYGVLGDPENQLKGEEKKIKQKFIVQNSYNSIFRFYNEPDDNSSFIENHNDIRGKVFYTTKGFGYKDGHYEWYQISIPEEGIINKWVNYGVSDFSSNSLYSLVYNHVVKETNVNTDFSGNTTFNGNAAYRLIRFDMPVLVSGAYIQLDHPAMNEGLQLKYEFIDVNQNTLGSYITTDDDLFNGSFVLPETYSNVVYVKVSNPNDNTVRGTYGIFGDPETQITGAEKAIKAKFMVTDNWNSTFKFYDKPNVDSTFVTNQSDIRNKVYYTTKGYGNRGNGNFEWYQISIPEEGIVNKWVNYGVSGFSSNSLYNLVYNHVVKENNVNTDYSGNTAFNGNTAYRLVRFDAPISISNAYIQLDHPAMDEGLQIKYEFLDINKDVVGSYATTEEDLFNGYFTLPQTYSGVVYVKISNPNNNTVRGVYGIFGDIENQITSLEKTVKTKFVVTDNWNSTFRFYDEPDVNSAFITNQSDIRNKVYYTTKGYGNRGNGNFEWYQISIPEEGIIDKWVNYGVSGFSSNSLFNLVYNRVVKENNVNTDYSGNTAFNGNAAYNLTRFEVPILVSGAFIQLDHPAMDEGLQLKYEFLDNNKNIMGSYTTTEEDLFNGYFALPQTYSNVVYVKVSNPNDNTVRGTYGIFGDPETQITGAEKAIKAKFMVTDNWNSTFKFYDKPNVDSTFVTNQSDIRNKVYYTTKGYGNRGNGNFGWYQISIPEEGIINKWVNYGVSGLYSNSLYDLINNRIEEENNVNTDYTGNTSFNGNAAYRLTKFETPISVSTAYIQLDHPSMDEGLQIKYEFMDANQSTIGSYTTTDEDLFNGYFSLTETYSNVVYVKISNPNNNNVRGVYGILGESDELPL